MGHEFSQNLPYEGTSRKMNIEVALMPRKFVPSQKEISEEQAGREKNVVRSVGELADYFISRREKDDENRNERAALEALMSESEIRLDTMEALIQTGTALNPEVRSGVVAITKKYLEAWRSTGSDKQKRLESIRLEFANFIRSKLA
jgi:hypothetical protein